MKNYLKGFKDFKLNESFSSFGFGLGGSIAASGLGRSRRNNDYNSPRRRASRMKDMDVEMEKPEITLHDIARENFGCEFWEIKSDKDKRWCLDEYRRLTSANESYNSEEYDPSNDDMLDLDREGDGVVTLDSIAMKEFGTTYDKLGPEEKEWCRDEYDSL